MITAQPGVKKVRQQFADTMLEVGVQDPKLVVLIGDISHFILQPFAKACPGRFYNIGICEPTIVSMAAGLSKAGLHPVVHTINPFIVERSFEQIKLDFCYQGHGGNLVTVGSMFDYSNLGCSHHCYGDFAMLKTLPRTQIFYPATAVEFDCLFRQVYAGGSLNFFRVAENQHGVSFDLNRIKAGSAIRVTEGSNLSIVATGPQLRNAMAARDGLQAMGWGAEIIYVHTVRPLDEHLIRASVAKTRRILVVEEHMRSGGLGDDILRATRDLGAIQYSSLSIPDVFVHDYGTYEQLCSRMGLSRDGILARVKSDFKK